MSKPFNPGANDTDFYDIRDDRICSELLEGVERSTLNDLISWILSNDAVCADEKRTYGNPKWQYSKTCPYDCFDYYAATGCPNCGEPYDLNLNLTLLENSTYYLTCTTCSHKACPLHFYEESDSFMDRFENNLKDSDTFGSLFNKSQCQDPAVKVKPIYIRGVRERYNFGNRRKYWWQSHFLPESVRLQKIQQVLAGSNISTLKAPIVREQCEKCGNNEAYYTTFQARSADEGLTIMYECTKCKYRKTFNN